MKSTTSDRFSSVVRNVAEITALRSGKRGRVRMGRARPCAGGPGVVPELGKVGRSVVDQHHRLVDDEARLRGVALLPRLGALDEGGLDRLLRQARQLVVEPQASVPFAARDFLVVG